MRLAAIIMAAGLISASAIQAQDTDPAIVSEQDQSALANARRVAAAVLAGDAESIIAQSDAKFVAEFGGEAKLRAFVTELPGKLGKETALDHDRFRLPTIGPIYSRIFKVEKGPPTRINIGFDGMTGLIKMLTVLPAATKGVHVPPRIAKTRLTLPFGLPRDGHVWELSSGGAAVIYNYHARLDTYYAIDIAPRALNTIANPVLSSDASCWDLPIRAAAPGKVAIALDGLIDEPKIGTTGDGVRGPGNHVIIDHENGEFTLYAHLRQGSISVKPGERLARGQQVGRCGNSGRSSIPHLHFQLMDGSDLDTARGIPPVFHDYFAPVHYVERGELVGGDVVLPAISLMQPSKK